MPGDSFYWTPVDHEADDPLLEKEPYIDPWDLENYAYIREHLESMELGSNPSAPSGSSMEFAEPTSSFDYVPATMKRKPSVAPSHHVMSHIREERFDSMFSDHENYAAIDDINNYHRRNRRATSEMYWPTARRRTVYDFDTETEEVSPYAEALPQENPIFGIYDEKGMFHRVALPVNYKPRDRSLSYSYGDFEHYHQFGQREESRKRFEEPRERMERRDSTLPIYDDMSRQTRSKRQNFGFSKYGHLKIDYSCSWNNLNKYMKCN